MVPVVIDVADLQAARPLAGEIGAWAEEFARDAELTRRVGEALGVSVRPLLGPGCQRFSAHAEQGVEEHADNNPYTALLYFSSLEEGGGGRLVFGDLDWAFTPQQGKAVVYPGHLKHRVTPQTRPGYRGMLALSYENDTPAERESATPPRREEG